MGKEREFEGARGKGNRGEGGREAEDGIMRCRFRDDAEGKRRSGERAAGARGSEGAWWRETTGNDADGKENRENGARSGSFKEAIL